MGVPPLHEAGLTGKGVLIAVFDAGFVNHSCVDPSRIIETWDFVGSSD
jgi:hypothetical protein